MQNEVLKVIKKSLGLEKMPNPEDHLFEDLNIHPGDLEDIADNLSNKFSIEIQAADIEKAETVAVILQIVKDKTNDIS